MARKGNLEEKLERVSALALAPPGPERLAGLRAALADSANLVVARAAASAADLELRDLVPDLVAAFARGLADPVRTDKGCAAKAAIVEALDRLDAGEEDLFRRGLRHVQLEPAWGKPVDAGALLRAKSAFALARLGGPEVLLDLTDLLADPEAEARRAAVKALAARGGPEVELLLRLKALAGDAEADIVGDCLAALLELSPDRSVAFAARFLAAADELLAAHAALALGNSRHPRAFEVLQQHRAESIGPAAKIGLLLPIALTRREEALDCLLAVIAGEHRDYAAAAVIAALKVFGGDTRAQARLTDAVAARGDAAVTRACQETLSRL